MTDEQMSIRRAFVVVSLFIVACFGIVAYLFSGTQVVVPALNESRDYKVSATIKDVDNLVSAGQVRIAGVEVGEVREMTPTEEGMRVVLALDEDAAPLHEGAQLRLGSRSLVGETYVGIEDGNGESLPSGTQLPAGSVKPSVKVEDVLASMDKDTRNDLGGMLRSLGKATKGTKNDLDSIATSLGDIGRDGHSAVDAVAAQSEQLRMLVRETGTLMSALDGSEGAVADLVSNGRRITDATSGQRDAIEESVRTLPGVLASAETATGSLSELSTALRPVAADLNKAGTPLSVALQELPATSASLRTLLPHLDGTLRRAPATLERVPSFSQDVRNIVPSAENVLREVNPMLDYMRPYGPELSGFVANFNAILGYTDEAGVHYARLLALGNEAVAQTPVDQGVTVYKNPHPKPGAGTNPGPFKGEYPRVERAPEFN